MYSEFYEYDKCFLSSYFFSFSQGGYLHPEEIKERFDSNCITPVSQQCVRTHLTLCLRKTRNFPICFQLSVVLQQHANNDIRCVKKKKKKVIALWDKSR